MAQLHSKSVENCNGLMLSTWHLMMIKRKKSKGLLHNFTRGGFTLLL